MWAVGSTTLQLHIFQQTWLHLSHNGRHSLGKPCHIWKFEKVAIELPTLAVWTALFFVDSNCRPWQFDGRFSALWPQTVDLGSLMAGFQHCGSFGSQTADLGSSMAAFQPLSKVAMKLPTLAVSWPLILPKNKWPWNCRPWQFHGQL